MMEKINIKDINLNESFFHFTSRDNLENISEEGLKAQIGEATKMVNDDARVYFSRGGKGILGIKNSFILEFQGISIKDIPEGYRKYFQTINDFTSEEKLTNEQIYEALSQRMKDEIYFVVDAKEGEDFQQEDMYGGLSSEAYDIKGIKGHDITPEKLKLLITDNGNTAHDVVSYLYNRLLEKARRTGSEEVVRDYLIGLDKMFEYEQKKEQAFNNNQVKQIAQTQAKEVSKDD